MGSSSRSYVDPEGGYTAAPAPSWRRAVAAAVDWTLAGVAYLVALIAAGLVQAVAATAGETPGAVAFWVTEVAALGVILAYFTGLLASGHTLGMRALDIHVRAAASGEAPGLARSFTRSVLGLVLATATLNAYAYMTGEPALGELTSVEEAAGRAAVGVAAAGALGGLWRVLDAEGRTVWDRLTGLVVVEDIVPSALPDRLWSPWGT
ncbi:MAG TPA: RDD family protein [Gaiellaceae bacterium]|nr:RDD family protein [Gaiellaceae bacterium]